MIIGFIEGQYELAAKEIEVDPEFREEYRNEIGGNRLNYDSEGHLIVDRSLFDAYRAFKLRRAVRRVYEHSRFYKRWFDSAGVSPNEIRTFSDLGKLPYTYPDDLRGESYDFLCISQRHVERPISFYSSGTTGIRKRMFYSFSDTERIKGFIGTAMNSIADPENARILSLMTDSQGRGASTVFVQSVRARGMQAWTCSMENGAEQILHASIEHGCNVWFGDIGTIFRTAKEMEDRVDLRSLGMKLLYVTMGNISDPVHGYLEQAFGCEVITHYGLTEVGWGFAIEQPGLGGYYSNELDIYTEAVDPVTGEPLPDGEAGELTFTIFGREAMPLLRYRSGDLATVTRAKNAGEFDTIGFIRGRLEGTMKTPSGTVITPAMIEDVIYRFPEVIDYRLYQTAADRLRLEIETVHFREGLEDNISQALRRIGGLSELPPADVVVLPRGALKLYCYEKKRFIRSGEA